jgi:hypothetical protein
MMQAMFTIQFQMSQQPVETIHPLVEDPPSTTLPEQTTVAGDLSFGVETVKQIQRNEWLSMIYTPFPINVYSITTSQVPGTSPIYDWINPWNIYLPRDYLPWFLWILQTAQAWTCKFKLRFEMIGHPAFRGSLGITLKPFRVPVPEDTYTNVSVWDYSADNAIFEIDVPQIYSSGQRLVAPTRNYNGTSDSDDNPLNPVFHTLDWNLGWLRVQITNPLVGSALLPDHVFFFVHLVPVPGTLKLYGATKPNQDLRTTFFMAKNQNTANTQTIANFPI